MTLQLSQLQAERAEWVKQNFPDDDMPAPLLGAVEEIGELSHHYLKLMQGIRGGEVHHREEMIDAVADCVIFLAGVCDWLEVDFGNAVQETWESVRERNWLVFKRNGVDS